MIKSFRDLKVWNLAIKITKKIYLLTKEFPKEERYGLSGQMQRAAVSIASNIAQGKTRRAKNEYINFLYIALSSTAELGTQLVFAKEVRYINNIEESDLSEKLDYISRMLRNLIKNLQDKRKPLTDNQKPR